MSQEGALSTAQIAGMREELAAGRTPTVWFTGEAVGVPQGRSGKVVTLDEPAEGDFIQVRPAGSKDVLSFSPSEVTVVKPARKQNGSGPGESTGKAGRGSAATSSAATSGRSSQSAAAKKGTTSARSGATSSQTASTGADSSGPASARASSAESATATNASQGSTTAPKRSAQDTSSSGSSTGKSARTKSAPAQSTTAQSGAAQSGAAKSGTARGSSTSGKRLAGGATVVLTASPDGQWTVEVNTGKKRTLRPTSVSASAVAQAAKALHPDVSAAVEPLLTAAREHQRARVEHLQEELRQAQQMLDDLGD